MLHDRYRSKAKAARSKAKAAREPAAPQSPQKQTREGFHRLPAPPPQDSLAPPRPPSWLWSERRRGPLLLLLAADAAPSSPSSQAPPRPACIPGDRGRGERASKLRSRRECAHGVAVLRAAARLCAAATNRR